MKNTLYRYLRKILVLIEKAALQNLKLAVGDFDRHADTKFFVSEMATPQPENEQADVEMTDRDEEIIDWCIEGVEVEANKTGRRKFKFVDSSLPDDPEKEDLVLTKLSQILCGVFEDDAALNTLCQHLTCLNYLE